MVHCQRWRNGARVPQGIALVLAALVAGPFMMTPSSAAEPAKAEAAEQIPAEANPGIDEVPVPEISRDGWRERVAEARRRAREAALERRTHPERFAIVPEDPDKVATDRALNDDSLQPGDIVATKKGLFVFRGRSDQRRGADDFIALPR